MSLNILRNPHFRLFAGAFLISFSPVFVRLVSVSATASAFYRTLFGGLALLLFLVAAGRRRLPARAVWIPLGSATVFFALDLWFWHRSILLIGPGLSTLLANLQVFFMMVAGVLFLGEKPRRIQVVAAPVALLGLWLILGSDRAVPDAAFRLGVGLGLLTAMSYAGYLLSMRRARRDSRDRLPIVEVTTVSLGIALLLGLAALAEGNSLAITATADLGWLLTYGVLAHAVGLMLIASSLTEATATEVGIALLLQPALSLLWDALFFGREFSAIELAGIVLTLAAIFLGSLRRVP